MVNKFSCSAEYVFCCLNSCALNTSVLAGSFCQIKEVWSLFYYFPWVILSVLLTALDVFCAVSYGPQLFNIVVSFQLIMGAIRIYLFLER